MTAGARTPEEIADINARLDAAIKSEGARIADLQDRVDWSALGSFAVAALNVGARLGLAVLASVGQDQIQAWGSALAEKMKG